MGNGGGCVEFGTCDFVVDANGAVTFIKWDVCVVVGKVKVGWDVACALGSETEEG